MAKENRPAKSLKGLITKVDVDNPETYFDEELALIYQNEIWYLNGEIYERHIEINQTNIAHSSSAAKPPVINFIEAIHGRTAQSYFDDDVADWYQNELWYRYDLDDHCEQGGSFDKSIIEDKQYQKNIYGDHTKNSYSPKLSVTSREENQIAVTNYGDSSSRTGSPLEAGRRLPQTSHHTEENLQISSTESSGIVPDYTSSRLDSGYSSTLTNLNNFTKEHGDAPKKVETPYKKTPVDKNGKLLEKPPKLGNASTTEKLQSKSTIQTGLKTKELETSKEPENIPKLTKSQPRPPKTSNNTDKSIPKESQRLPTKPRGSLQTGKSQIKTTSSTNVGSDPITKTSPTSTGKTKDLTGLQSQSHKPSKSSQTGLVKFGPKSSAVETPRNLTELGKLSKDPSTQKATTNHAIDSTAKPRTSLLSGKQKTKAGSSSSNVGKLPITKKLASNEKKIMTPTQIPDLQSPPKKQSITKEPKNMYQPFSKETPSISKKQEGLPKREDTKSTERCRAGPLTICKKCPCDNTHKKMIYVCEDEVECPKIPEEPLKTAVKAPGGDVPKMEDVETKLIEELKELTPKSSVPVLTKEVEALEMPVEKISEVIPTKTVDDLQARPSSTETGRAPKGLVETTKSLRSSVDKLEHILEPMLKDSVGSIGLKEVPSDTTSVKFKSPLTSMSGRSPKGSLRRKSTSSISSTASLTPHPIFKTSPGSTKTIEIDSIVTAETQTGPSLTARLGRDASSYFDEDKVDLYQNELWYSYGKKPGDTKKTSKAREAGSRVSEEDTTVPLVEIEIEIPKEVPFKLGEHLTASTSSILGLLPEDEQKLLIDIVAKKSGTSVRSIPGFLSDDQPSQVPKISMEISVKKSTISSRSIPGLLKDDNELVSPPLTIEVSAKKSTGSVRSIPGLLPEDHPSASSRYTITIGAKKSTGSVRSIPGLLKDDYESVPPTLSIEISAKKNTGSVRSIPSLLPENHPLASSRYTIEVAAKKSTTSGSSIPGLEPDDLLASPTFSIEISAKKKTKGIRSIPGLLEDVDLSEPQKLSIEIRSKKSTTNGRSIPGLSSDDNLVEAPMVTIEVIARKVPRAIPGLLPDDHSIAPPRYHFEISAKVDGKDISAPPSQKSTTKIPPESILGYSEDEKITIRPRDSNISGASVIGGKEDSITSGQSAIVSLTKDQGITIPIKTAEDDLSILGVSPSHKSSLTDPKYSETSSRLKDDQKLGVETIKPHEKDSQTLQLSPKASKRLHTKASTGSKPSGLSKDVESTVDTPARTGPKPESPDLHVKQTSAKEIVLKISTAKPSLTGKAPKLKLKGSQTDEVTKDVPKVKEKSIPSSDQDESKKLSKTPKLIEENNKLKLSDVSSPSRGGPVRLGKKAEDLDAKQKEPRGEKKSASKAKVSATGFGKTKIIKDNADVSKKSSVHVELKLDDRKGSIKESTKTTTKKSTQTPGVPIGTSIGSIPEVSTSLSSSKKLSLISTDEKKVGKISPAKKLSGIEDSKSISRPKATGEIIKPQESTKTSSIDEAKEVPSAVSTPSKTKPKVSKLKSPVTAPSSGDVETLAPKTPPTEADVIFESPKDKIKLTPKSSKSDTGSIKSRDSLASKVSAKKSLKSKSTKPSGQIGQYIPELHKKKKTSLLKKDRKEVVEVPSKISGHSVVEEEDRPSVKGSYSAPKTPPIEAHVIFESPKDQIKLTPKSSKSDTGSIKSRGSLSSKVSAKKSLKSKSAKLSTEIGQLTTESGKKEKTSPLKKDRKQVVEIPSNISGPSVVEKGSHPSLKVSYTSGQSAAELTIPPAQKITQTRKPSEIEDELDQKAYPKGEELIIDSRKEVTPSGMGEIPAQKSDISMLGDSPQSKAEKLEGKPGSKGWFSRLSCSKSDTSPERDNVKPEAPLGKQSPDRSYRIPEQGQFTPVEETSSTKTIVRQPSLPESDHDTKRKKPVSKIDYPEKESLLSVKPETEADDLKSKNKYGDEESVTSGASAVENKSKKAPKELGSVTSEPKGLSEINKLEARSPGEYEEYPEKQSETPTDIDVDSKKSKFGKHVPKKEADGDTIEIYIPQITIEAKDLDSKKGKRKLHSPGKDHRIKSSRKEKKGLFKRKFGKEPGKDGPGVKVQIQPQTTPEEESMEIYFPNIILETRDVDTIAKELQKAGVLSKEKEELPRKKSPDKERGSKVLGKKGDQFDSKVSKVDKTAAPKKEVAVELSAPESGKVEIDSPDIIVEKGDEPLRKKKAKTGAISERDHVELSVPNVTVQTKDADKVGKKLKKSGIPVIKKSKVPKEDKLIFDQPIIPGLFEDAKIGEPSTSTYDPKIPRDLSVASSSQGKDFAPKKTPKEFSKDDQSSGRSSLRKSSIPVSTDRRKRSGCLKGLFGKKKRKPSEENEEDTGQDDTGKSDKRSSTGVDIDPRRSEEKMARKKDKEMQPGKPPKSGIKLASNKVSSEERVIKETNLALEKHAVFEFTTNKDRPPIGNGKNLESKEKIQDEGVASTSGMKKSGKESSRPDAKNKGSRISNSVRNGSKGLPPKNQKKTGKKEKEQRPRPRKPYRGPLVNVEIEEEDPDRIIYSGYDRAFVYPRPKKSYQDMSIPVEELDRPIRSGYDKAFARPRCQKLMFVKEEYDSPKPLPSDRGGPGVGVGSGTVQNYYQTVRNVDRERQDRYGYDKDRYKDRPKEDRKKGKCWGWII